MSFVCHLYAIRMYSYVIRVSLVCTRMSYVCHSYVLVCHPYVTRIHSYVIRMSLVFTRMSSVCHSYVIRMSLVCTHMSPVCNPYVTRMSSVCHSSVVLPWTLWNHWLLLQRSFCWNITEKRKLEKCFLSARFWALKPVYRFPKQPEYVTENNTPATVND